MFPADTKAPAARQQKLSHPHRAPGASIQGSARASPQTREGGLKAPIHMDIRNTGHPTGRMIPPQLHAHGLNHPGAPIRGNVAQDAHFGRTSDGWSIPGDPDRMDEDPSLRGNPATLPLPRRREPEQANHGGTVPQAPRPRPLLSFMSQLQDHDTPSTQREQWSSGPQGPKGTSQALNVDTPVSLSTVGNQGERDIRRGGNNSQAASLLQYLTAHNSLSHNSLLNPAGAQNPAPVSCRNDPIRDPSPSAGPSSQELRNLMAHARGGALGCAPQSAVSTGVLGDFWGDPWGDPGPEDTGRGPCAGNGGIFPGHQKLSTAAFVQDRGGVTVDRGLNKENRRCGALWAQPSGEKQGLGGRGNGLRDGGCTTWGLERSGRGVASPPPPAMDDVNLLSTGLWTP